MRPARRSRAGDDDGSLQRELDDRFGAGLVVVICLEALRRLSRRRTSGHLSYPNQVGCFDPSARFA